MSSGDTEADILQKSQNSVLGDPNILDRPVTKIEFLRFYDYSVAQVIEMYGRYKDGIQYVDNVLQLRLLLLKPCHMSLDNACLGLPSKTINAVKLENQ